LKKIHIDQLLLNNNYNTHNILSIYTLVTLPMNIRTIVNVLFTIVSSFIMGVIGFSIPFIIHDIFAEKYYHNFDLTDLVLAIPGMFLAVYCVKCSILYAVPVLDIILRGEVCYWLRILLFGIEYNFKKIVFPEKSSLYS
jgi:hypothetical protein